MDKKYIYDKIINERSVDTTDYGLGEIIRYAGKTKIKQESVAEHSFMVALNVLRVGTLLELPIDTINRAVVRGLLHDVPEQYFGDLPYDFKMIPEFKSDLEKMENKFNKMLCDEIYLEKFGNSIIDTLFKKNDVEDRLVKLADRISARQYAKREILLGNNSKNMEIILKKSEKSLIYDINRLILVIKD